MDDFKIVNIHELVEKLREIATFPYYSEEQRDLMLVEELLAVLGEDVKEAFDER